MDGRRGGKSGMIEYLIYGGLGGVSVLEFGELRC